MSWFGRLRTAAFALALTGLSAPPVEAIEFVGGAGPAAQMTDGLLAQVRAVRHGGGHRGGARPGGGHRGGARPGGGHRPGNVHRPVHRPGGGHRPPGHRPPVNRPGHRPPVHRPPGRRPGYRPPVHRPGVRPPVHRPVVVAPRAVWVGRPGWYRWNPGGAIAAGAALGFVAASAATWAGPPPQPGLCWYYTDPSRRQGFWDACP